MAKILLVEDDNNLREIYEARLQAEGYDIVAARDGEEALVVAKTERPDLVISDVMMPKISGFEMLDIMRNTEELKHVKVIMLTALGQSDDQTRASSLGADRYLVKSQVTLEDIVNVSQQLLTQAGAIAAPAAAEPVATPEPMADPSPQPVVEPTPVAEPVTPAPAMAVAPAPMAVATPPQDEVLAETDTPAPVVAPPVTDVSDDTSNQTPVTPPAPVTQSVVPEPASEAPVTVPEPVSADEPVVSEPTVQPVTPAIPEPTVPTAAPVSDQPQTVAQEEADIQQQIESFVAAQDGQAPAQVEPTTEPVVLEPEITTPETPAPSDPFPAAEVSAPPVIQTSGQMVAEPTAEDDQQTRLEGVADQLSGETSAAPAHEAVPTSDLDDTPKKKVIQPLSSTEDNKKSLDQLLEQEEMKQNGLQPGQPAAPTQPQQPQPARNPNDFDPNSIAL